MNETDDKFEQSVATMRRLITRDVAGGFRDLDGIAESAVEVVAYGDTDPTPFRPIAERLLREAVAEHYQAQTDWSDRTDCDRLDEAFAELESRGIVCRQDFSCCGTCGSGEIWDEMDAAANAGAAVRGYTFYHMQDTESAVGGYGLYLAYGARDEGEPAALAVANEIVTALNAHGLATEWNGRWDTRIKVAIEWKRRRPFIAGFGCGSPRGR